MCGIAGIITPGAPDASQIKRMVDAVAHRGPDDEGVWLDAEAGIGLGHRRLSIIDLSPLGHQPMASADGRFILSFNGEIYNHAALRRALDEGGEAPAWRGHSDTETLVEAVAAWGVEATLEKCVGMFAISVWDRSRRLLHLARDRFGEKPLYFGWVGGDFVFASELKALRTHPRFANEIDRRSLRLFAARAYIPAPLSIYRDVYKLQPGCILTANPEVWRAPPSAPPVAGFRDAAMSIAPYWSYRDVVYRGLADPIRDEGEALERLESVLAAAIEGQAVADVPVGAFLSGGVDSSTVVGLYQKYSRGKVRTFTIGFEDDRFDEADFAAKVARHFGTEHHEHYVTVREAQDIIPALPHIYDEPFADSSQIPTHLVSRFARAQVTVALSGDGGDELFGGYNRYFGTARLWAQMKRLPHPVRALAGRGFGGVPPHLWNRLADLLPGGKRPPQFGVKVQKTFRTMAGAGGLDDVFTSFLDEWAGESSPVLGAGSPAAECAFDLAVEPAPDAARMMYCDAVSYLPDDILCKVDRAAMAVSLETRVPFLDHRVAELAARVPLEMKIRGGGGKHILRKLLYREAPAALFERPKAGFAVPVGEWIKGPLRPWAEDLLDRRRIEEQGWFDPGRVHRRWQQHLGGERDSTPALWAILMFQAWQQSQPALSVREAA